MHPSVLLLIFARQRFRRNSPSPVLFSSLRMAELSTRYLIWRTTMVLWNVSSAMLLSCDYLHCIVNNVKSYLTNPCLSPAGEAAISAETMTIHHTKHHNTYIANLNASLEKLDAAMSSGDVSGIISLQGALKFNGGGHLNHTLFWENLSPEKSSPTGALEKSINESFGSFEKMKSELSAKSIAVQGSGWGWLGFNSSTSTYSSY